MWYFELILAAICFIFISVYRQRNEILFDWPFLGMLPALVGGADIIHELCTVILRQSGGTFLFKGPWFTHTDRILTGDPANVHYIMSVNFQNFPKGGEFRAVFDVLGDGIFTSDDDLWRFHRRVTSGLINQQKFHRFLAKMSRLKVEKGLIPVLEYVCEKGVVVDMQDVFQRLTFDTTCMFITGCDPGCLSRDFKEVPFATAMDDAEEAIFERHILPPIIWKMQKRMGIGKEKKLKKAARTLDSVIGDLISKKRNELSKGAVPKDDTEGVDLLTSLITEYQNTFSDGFTKTDDKFLRDTILNLMIAGRDTTSSSLTWFLWLVVTNPSVAKKIRDEIRGIISEIDTQKLRFFEAQETEKMIYLHAAFCEALRLYPPVPFELKVPTQQDVLPSGHRVDPNTKIFFSLYGMGRMETTWGEDCCEFKPERWITNKGTIKHEPSYKFLAFNAGPRTCLGKQVAFTQMKAAAASILHNYDVKVVEGHPMAPNVSIILYMKHGFKVRVHRRCS